MSGQIASWRQAIMTTSSAAAVVGIAAGATTGAIIAGAASLVSGVASGAVAAATEARSTSPPPPSAAPPDAAAQGDEWQGFDTAEDLQAALDAEILGSPPPSPLMNGAPTQVGGTPEDHATGEGISLSRENLRVRGFQSFVRSRGDPQVGVAPEAHATGSESVANEREFVHVPLTRVEEVEPQVTLPPTFGDVGAHPVCTACLPENSGKGFPHLHYGTCTATFVMLDAEKAGHCLAATMVGTAGICGQAIASLQSHLQ